MTKILKKLPVDRVVDVECDICHASCIKGQYGPEFATLRAHWGYGSKMDGEMHECDICEECYAHIKAYIESLGGQVRTTEKGSLWQTPNG